MATSPAHAIHATAVLIGTRAVLIRGASGAGKSTLGLGLLDAATARGRFARLIGDDRVFVAAGGGRLIARAAPTIAGLIEVRGHGLVDIGHEPAGVVGLVVDLMDTTPARLPEASEGVAEIAGCRIARLALAERSGLSAIGIIFTLIYPAP